MIKYLLVTFSIILIIAATGNPSLAVSISTDIDSMFNNLTPDYLGHFDNQLHFQKNLSEELSNESHGYYGK